MPYYRNREGNVEVEVETKKEYTATKLPYIDKEYLKNMEDSESSYKYKEYVSNLPLGHLPYLLG